MYQQGQSNLSRDSALFVFCLQTNFSLQQSDRQTSGRILQQHSDQEAPAESRTGTRNDLIAWN